MAQDSIRPSTQRVKRQPFVVGDIAIIPLTQGKYAIIDAVDLPLVKGATWCYRTSVRGHGWAGTRRGQGKGTVVRMHRRILGLTDDDLVVDHKNGDSLDNRRANLRVTTQAENVFNQRLRSNSTTGFKGVTFDKAKGKFAARVQARGRPRHIGYYSDPEDAARAYDEAARRVHGEFARLNFP